MKIHRCTALVAVLSLCAVVSCSTSVKSGDLSIKSGPAFQIQSANASKALFEGPSELSTVTADGSVVAFKTVGTAKEAVSDQFGSGTVYVFKGESVSGPKLTRELRISAYDQFPSTLVVKAVYTNASGEAVDVDGWTLCDVKLRPAAEDPCVWSFQGQSTEDRADWLIPIKDEFYQKNFMGMNNSDYGGGIPVVCLWRRDAGVIVGHLAPNPEIVSLPVEKKKGEDFISVSLVKEYDGGLSLAAGESFETYNGFINVYEGDCFGALRNYAALLEKVGVVMPESEPEAFETAWCAWGYERRFTIDEIIGTLPKVKELGFKWATLDDGYQIAEGDWDLTKARFPHGDADMKYMVDKFHEYGLKAELWWAPLAADPGTEFLKKYPESIIRDKEGKPQRITWWNSWYLSPVDEDVVREQGELVRKFIEDYGFDGLKLDGQHMNAVAPDYNPAHHPDDPEKDVRELPTFFKMIFDTARGIKPHAVLQYCPCGDCFSVYNLPYTNKTVSSDPESSYQIRTKGYVLRAIAPKTAYYGDHIELSDGENDYPTQLGIGAVIGTKFTWPKDNPYVRHSYLLTPEREALLKNALAIYEEKQLSRGELLGGLYDIGFDYPETYVIRQHGKMYYAFYATGEPVQSVELRGLEPGKTYKVEDYYNHVDLGTVTASAKTVLEVPVEKYLLVEVSEIPQDVTETLLLKNYRPVSVFKLPEHKPDHPKFTVIDMHSHDYLTDQEGVKGWAKLLDEQHIERVVVNTMGHGDEFERIYDLYKGVSDKFELWCGFNMERWGEDDFVETALADLERCHKKGAKGVGELGDKGLGEQYCVNRSFTDCVPTAHFNDPLFAPLFDKCGELGMPVNIHIGDPIWMYEPIDEHNDGLMNAAHWAIDLSTPGILDLDELVDTFLETLDAHPKTTFIAAHLLNYNHDYAKLGAILDAHPNLYIDISARHAETAVTPRATAAFYEKYQDRIVFGTDNDPSPRMYQLNWRLLETEDEHIYAGSYHWPLFGLGLSDQVLHKIYHDNAVKIMGY